jgi:asparagine synthase (glutamine-hydrolysing)
MCGIVGTSLGDAQLIRRMANRIAHRGPDDDGFYVDSNVSLGQRRLKIIDLTQGIYPIHNEAGNIQMVFNGEIFNYQELRRLLELRKHKFYTQCDAEVIVHLYEEYGPDCVRYLNGQFAIGLWDGKRFFLARDQMGIRPLYYSFLNGVFCFASEAKALLELVPPKLNETALKLYEIFDCVPAPLTMFSGISKLEPSHYLIWANINGVERCTTERYADISFDNPPKGKLLDVLQDSVKSQMMSDVPIGMYLSGGMDSSTVLALMSKCSDRVKTISVGYESNEALNELAYAKSVADMYATDHHELIVGEKNIADLKKIVWHLDEPVANPTIIPLFALSKFAKKNNISVSLSGSGGDELFAGYRQHIWMSRLSKMKWLHTFTPIWKLFYGNSNRYIKFGAKFLSYANSPINAYNELVFHGQGESILRGYNLFTKPTSVLNQVTEAEIRTTLTNQYLFMEDKMNMAHAVEGRIPLLDSNVVDFVANLPEGDRLNGSTTKYLLRTTMKDLLPVASVQRPKNGFTVPFKTWYKSTMKSMLSEYQPNSPLLQNDSNENINKAFSQLILELWKDNYLN